MYILNATPTVSNCTFLYNTTGDDYAGAVYTKTTAPVLTDCLFENNQSKYGGAVYSQNSTISYVGCTFRGNTAVEYGGAAYGEGLPTPSYMNCLFEGNSAGFGGGAIEGSFTLAENCVFTGNTATDTGGAIDFFLDSNPVISNCVFYNNSSDAGGAIWAGSTNFTATSCIFWGNTANFGIVFEITDAFGTSSNLTIANCIQEGGIAGISNVNSNVIDNGGVIDADPLFADAAGGDFHLPINSPAIDAGTPSSTTRDFDDVQFFDIASVPNTGSGAPDFDDIGPYEYVDPTPLTVLYVAPAPTGDDANNGQTIYSPLATIQHAVDMLTDGGEAILMDGTYTGPGNYEIWIEDKEISLHSQNGPAGCIIDCQSLGWGLFFTSSGGTGLIEGLTIRNGVVADLGGGIYIASSEPIVRNCVIENCVAGIRGGGICVDSWTSYPLVEDCVVRNCRVINSTADAYGGGIDNLYGTISNCHVSDC